MKEFEIIPQETTKEIITNNGANKDILLIAFLSSLNVKESSKEAYRRSLVQFFKWIGLTNRSLSEISRREIVEYRNYLETELKVSTLTTGSYLISVRKFFEWTESEKLYPNIAKGVKPTEGRSSNSFEKQYLSDEKSSELLNYYQTTSLRNFAIVNLMLRTGLRCIEVARAKVEDITFMGDKRVLKVWGKGKTESSKGKDYNFVVLTEKTYQPIRDYLDKVRKGARGGDYLFTSTSNNNQGEGLTTRSISQICKDGLKAIGLDGREYTAHSLRHTTASSLLEHGCNLIEVQRVLRHTNPSTTQIYTKMKEREIRLESAPENALDNAF